MSLTEIIPFLEAMDFNSIRDWIDYVEYFYTARLIADEHEQNHFLKSVRNRRSGLPTGGLPSPFPFHKPALKMLSMTTQEQIAAQKLLSQMDGDSQKLAVDIAKALHRAKSPIRRTSRGNIEVKWIPYEYMLRDIDGMPVIDENGKPIIVRTAQPYLYLRYWQVQGDNNRQMFRKKSLYIGGTASHAERIDPSYQYPFRSLAHHFHDLLQQHGIERQRLIRKTGEIQTYYVRPKGDDNPIAQLEREIMVCINMDEVDTHGSAAIDVEALDEVQSQWCRDN